MSSVVSENAVSAPPAIQREHSPYRGFVGGVFSGISKLAVGHPFDTIKVRLQTSPPERFKGPWDCLLKTWRHESYRGLYKGATPPLVGWMFMDSIMLGTLSNYRALLKTYVYHDKPALPVIGHATAGVFAGWTVSFIAAPVEHVKARLQVQYHRAGSTTKPRYSGPIDCTRQLVRGHGIQGLYHGLGATMLFRTFFFVWWGSYEIFSNILKEKTTLSAPMVNFWAGGLSAQAFWLTSYPSDVVKQRIMTDPLEPGERKFRRWRDAAKTVYHENGWKGYWRGFVPCFLRAFPANAMALVAFEAVMRTLP
ncbi:mitochondrial carrier domain-containing protein [Tricharina praecox]|uniref:mitochondrial carrier domain-containing protein n=1 Tax=Tricharina praecox TaxID=43433 RepID=UPI00221F75D6|nr:mitochondrial carrier domain-containing protein [Tricharina praecox]KAI5853831.1 mitochondrial carrier domain-containing protein [Tricharina praecox]